MSMENDELFRSLSRHGRIDRSEMASDRRSQPRVMIFLTATLIIDDQQHEVVTRDISRNGVGLVCHEPIDVGRVVGLQLKTPWDEIITRQVEILRCFQSSGFFDVAGLFV
jgi:hypothetical protein